MLIQNKVFSDEEDKVRFVNECESKFEKLLDDAVAEIQRDSEVKIVTLSGPTCSGKTTISNKLIKEFNERGRKIYTISIDDFFKKRNILNDRVQENAVKLDYDSIDAIEFDVLVEAVTEILNGRKVNLPKYDFVVGNCTEYRSFDPSEYDLIIFEGIQAIYPEIVKLFSGYKYKSIYVSVGCDLLVHGEVFTARQTRLIRRIVRDVRYRNAQPAFTFMLWENVTRNELSNIIPYEDTTDIKINSLLPYEANVMKKSFFDVISKMPPDSKYYGEAVALATKFKNICEIDRKYIPKTSVYREFLG